MKKINSVADALIRSFLAQMVSTKIISEKEAIFKKIEVEEKKIVFLISEKLKELLETQISARKPKFATTRFEKSSIGGWLFTVEDAGAESFFFARQLQRILHRNENRSDKCRYIKLNMSFLEMATLRALTKASVNPEDFTFRVDFKTKTYCFLINFKGNFIKKFSLRDKSIDFLSIKIAQEIPIWAPRCY